MEIALKRKEVCICFVYETFLFSFYFFENAYKVHSCSFPLTHVERLLEPNFNLTPKYKTVVFEIDQI